MQLTNWLSKFKRFYCSEDGPTTVEYAVMLALIVGVCVGAVRSMSTATGSSFDRSAQAISQALAN